MTVALKNVHCQHGSRNLGQVVLITIGNSLRGDDGVAKIVSDQIVEPLAKAVCRFDLGIDTGHLGSCIEGHCTCVIIDSTKNGIHPGAVTQLELGALLEDSKALTVESVHGFSLWDELKLAQLNRDLPKRIVFFGIEVENVDWGQSMSPAIEARLTGIVSELNSLIADLIWG